MPKASASDPRFNVAAMKKKDFAHDSRDGKSAEHTAEGSDAASDEEVVINEDEGSEGSESGSEVDEQEESEDGEEEEEEHGNSGCDSGESSDSDASVVNETYESNEEEDGEDDANKAQGRVRGKKKKVRGVLGREELQKFKEQAEQTGVVYISRIPPFMKPIKLRHYFSSYGTVGRIYLQAEDAMARKKRQRMGGNKKKKFTEGWVEFLDKRDAKVVAKTLNNQPVGGRKRSYYAYDLWNIKYLPKFKWSHLTERIAYENAVREKKLQLEVRQATRENNFYLENVDKSRMIRDMEARKKAKRPIDEEAPVLRTFKQRPMLDASQGRKKAKTGSAA